MQTRISKTVHCLEFPKSYESIVNFIEILIVKDTMLSCFV